MARETLGEFEQLVMLAIVRLDDGAYGVPILEEIGRHSERRVLRPAVYVALRRLEEKGLIVSEQSEPRPERGGRARRYYRVTALGQEVASLEAERLTTLIDAARGKKLIPARPRS